MNLGRLVAPIRGRKQATGKRGRAISPRRESRIDVINEPGARGEPRRSHFS